MSGEETVRSISPPGRDPVQVGARFNIVKSLGAGGMGKVYLAEDAVLHRNVAIKTVREELSSNEEIRKRIERECLLHAKVGSHPHIVTLFDKIEENGRIHLVMEYVDGETLQSLLERNAKEGISLPTEEAVSIVMQCLDALSVIHAQGIIHRDIKPANLMLARGLDGAGWTAKLTDFGIARLEAGSESLVRLTTTSGSSPGTPLYMAPEQIDPETYGPVSYATDVYAAGVVLYELVSGEPPFKGSMTAVLSGHLKKPVPPIRLKGDTAIPAGLMAIIERALAKNPAERFPSARAFLAALATCPVSLAADTARVSPIHLDDTAAACSLVVESGLEKGATRPFVSDTRRPASARRTRLFRTAGSVAAILVVSVCAWLLARGGNEGGSELSGGPSVTSPNQQQESALGAPSSSDTSALEPDILSTLSPGSPAQPYLPSPTTPADAPSTEPASALAASLAPTPQSHGQQPGAGDSSATSVVAGTQASNVGPTYVVKSGDSLSKIAKETGRNATDLARWNLLERPDNLEVGQTLYLYERPNLPEVKIEWGTAGSVRKPMSAEEKVEPLRVQPATPAASVEPTPAKKKGLRGLWERVRRK